MIDQTLEWLATYGIGIGGTLTPLIFWRAYTWYKKKGMVGLIQGVSSVLKPIFDKELKEMKAENEKYRKDMELVTKYIKINAQVNIENPVVSIEPTEAYKALLKDLEA